MIRLDDALATALFVACLVAVYLAMVGAAALAGVIR